MHQLAIDITVLPDMEAWINLLTLDSQTSSQIISEESLRNIHIGLRKSDVLSKESFEILSKALSEKIPVFKSKPIPATFFDVLKCLCEHLSKRKDVAPEDVRNFFSTIIEVVVAFICVYLFFSRLY